MTAHFFLLLLLSAVTPAAAAPDYGILLMAHGGDASWNQCIADIRGGIEARLPVETAFGMAEAQELKQAVLGLEARGVGKIVAVPLFINSASEVLDHSRYVLGLRKQPSLLLRDALADIKPVFTGPAHRSHHSHGFSLERVTTSLPLVMTSALDSHPLIAQILLDRAKTLSRDPGRETVILVGHGPVDEKADAVWLKTMNDLASVMQSQGAFRSVRAVTIRDDSPKVVKKKAAAALRAMVFEGGKNGRALVIPFLLARGGIERNIVGILKGLRYVWDGSTLCPHPNLQRWVLEVGAQGAQKENMRRYQ